MNDSTNSQPDFTKSTRSENGTSDQRGVPPSTVLFDPRALRLPQNFDGAAAGARRILTTVPIRKPHRQEFVRVHPDAEQQMSTMLLNVKDEGECYVVGPRLWNELDGELVPTTLVLAVNRQRVAFLWPLRLPRSDGRIDRWSHSARDAIERAKKRWVRVASNMSLGAYEVFEALVDGDDPEWPSLPFDEVLRLAFQDRVIDQIDHPVLRRLRGEMP